MSRARLTRPIGGRVGNARIFLVDVSVEGLRIAHQSALPAVGQTCRLAFEWQGQLIELDCEVIHNTLYKLARGEGEKSTYHAGLRIASAVGDSAAALKKLVADVVARALDEQKANARGIPAAAAEVFQSGKGTDFVRCELIDGTWRRTVTSRPEQPANGFTVSADEAADQVEMLCQTYESSDAQGRKLIQLMSEMSISKSEGVPTRRYNP